MALDEIGPLVGLGGLGGVVRVHSASLRLGRARQVATSAMTVANGSPRRHSTTVTPIERSRPRMTARSSSQCAAGQPVRLPRRRVEEAEGRHLDHGQIAAPALDPGQQAGRPRVDQRGQGDHVRPGRKGLRRDDGQAALGERHHHLGVEDGVDQPVELARAEPRHDPVEVAAEAHQPDPVLHTEVGPAQRHDRLDRHAERRVEVLADLDERVEQQHDVGAAVGVTVAHEPRAPTGADPPVDRPHPVARRPRPGLGVLDAVGPLP